MNGTSVHMSTALGAALQTSGAFVLILLVGMATTRVPGLLDDPAIISRIARITMLVMGPLLLATSLGESMPLELFKSTGYVLALWCCANIGLSSAVAYALFWACKVPPVYRLPFICACSFQNALSVPLVYVGTLCQTDPLASADFGVDSATGDAVRCVDRANAFIFVYSVGWFVLFFGVAYPVLNAPAAPAGGGGWPRTASGVAGSVWRAAVRVFNANMWGVVAGLVIGLNAPLRDELFSPGGRMLWVASAAETLGEPLIGIFALLVGATLGQTAAVLLARRAGRRSAAGGPELIWSGGEQPGPRQAHRALEKTVDPAGLAGEELPTRAALATFVLGKMVLVPLCNILLIYWCADAVFESTGAAEDDLRLIKVVLVLEALSPSVPPPSPPSVRAIDGGWRRQTRFWSSVSRLEGERRHGGSR